MIELSLQKDGQGLVIHVWEVDESKPDMDVGDDGIYVFNRNLIQSIRFQSAKALIDKLNGTE